jgi:hypothetical protein
MKLLKTKIRICNVPAFFIYFRYNRQSQEGVFGLIIGIRNP